MSYYYYKPAKYDPATGHLWDDAGNGADDYCVTCGVIAPIFTKPDSCPKPFKLPDMAMTLPEFKMEDDWSRLARKIGEVMMYMRSFVAKESKITIILRREIPGEPAQQFIASEIATANIPEYLRAVADRHAETPDFTGVGISQNGGPISIHKSGSGGKA